MKNSETKESTKNAEKKIEAATPQEASQGTNPTVSLASVIEESKERIANAEIAPPKNKGGRPKGSKTKPKNEVGTSDSQVGAGQSQPIPAQAPRPLLPVLRYAVAAPFDFAAGRTGFEKFRLDDTEREELADITEQCIAHYFPNLGEKTSLLVTCVATFGIVFYGKTQLYSAAMARQLAEQEQKQKEELANPPMPDASNGLGVFPTMSN